MKSYEITYIIYCGIFMQNILLPIQLLFNLMIVKYIFLKYVSLASLSRQVKIVTGEKLQQIFGLALT